MGWTRHWHIGNKQRLHQVLSMLTNTLVSAEAPLELILRTPRVEKTSAQRALWHAVLSDAAPQLGLTPNELKQLIMEEFHGVHFKTVFGSARRFCDVESSEDADKEEYSRRIDFTYQFLAEKGIVVPDRRPR